MQKKTIYTLKGVNKETGEISSYVGKTNDLSRRLKEHTRSGLIDALCNDGLKEGWISRSMQGLLQILSFQSENRDEDELNTIKEQKGRNLNQRGASCWQCGRPAGNGMGGLCKLCLSV